MAGKKVAKVDVGRCVSCGACTHECPKGAIRVWKGCFAIVEEALCIGCGKCERTCPAGCIKVREGGER